MSAVHRFGGGEKNTPLSNVLGEFMRGYRWRGIGGEATWLTSAPSKQSLQLPGPVLSTRVTGGPETKCGHPADKHPLTPQRGVPAKFGLPGIWITWLGSGKLDSLSTSFAACFLE